MSGTQSPLGGAFLLGGAVGEPETIFTPEQFSSDARLMAKTVEVFVRNEVIPVNQRLEAHEPGLMRRLLEQAGELGLLGIGIPERYNGLDLPKSQVALLMETAGIHPSFAISAGVHLGVSMFPLLFFGTEEQKQQYLPRLATGEYMGAFALSEANSGSDALSAQAKAIRSPDGAHFLLTGTKMWITNGGFADLFTVFARLEGEGFSAFLVERNSPGISTSREEHKLGLRGSSTVRVVLDNAQVPIGSFLGEAGKGHRPALYALNLGRLAIAATALGMSKESLRSAAQYALQRSQFGQPIARFGLIQHKLAEMAIRIFVLESMLYRTAGYLDSRFSIIAPDAPDAQAQYREAAEEYAIECAILKVFGTETLDYVVDEALQIHGGYGFSEEFAAAQAYRDARVFRIFEGTNEINRITIIDQILRRERSGRLTLALLEQDQNQCRRAALSSMEASRSRFGEKLMEQQEMVGLLADSVAAVYASQSAWLRCRQVSSSDPWMLAAAEVYGSEASIQGWHNLCEIISATDANKTAYPQEEYLPRTRNTIALRRQVAAAVIERGGYPSPHRISQPADETSTVNGP